MKGPDIQAGEGRSVALMLGHSFAMGAATVFFETAASALFLARFGSAALPYVYVAAALLNTAVGAFYARIQDRIPFARLMSGTLWFLLLTVAGLRIGLGLSDGAWPVFLLLSLAPDPHRPSVLGWPRVSTTSGRPSGSSGWSARARWWPASRARSRCH